MINDSVPLERILTSLSPVNWKMRKTIIFDWYDGPREGVCVLSEPACCFFFQLLAEESHTENGAHLFSLKELPLNTFDELALIIGVLGVPKEPIWVPIWRFSDDSSRIKVEKNIETLLMNARTTDAVICTTDFIRFTGCWRLSSTKDTPHCNKQLGTSRPPA